MSISVHSCRCLGWLLTGCIVGAVGGCSFFRSGWEGRSPGHDVPILPATATSALERRGFRRASALPLDSPKSAWWCVRPIRVPANRMAAAVGWYHEWIATPDREAGADFYGSDSVRGGWPASLWSLLRPLYVINHKGAAKGSDVWCRPIQGHDYERLQGELKPGRPAGRLIFPFHNCNTWVPWVIRRSRAAEPSAP